MRIGTPGLLGQSMGGSKPPQIAPLFSRTFPPNPNTVNWTVPATGNYEIGAWSPGMDANGNGGNVACTGAFAMARRYLRAGQVVAISVGYRAFLGGSAGGGSGNITDTTVTLPGGLGTIQCTKADAFSPTAGSATGGDVNINGSTSAVANLDGPSYDSGYVQYLGGSGSSGFGQTPGGAGRTGNQASGGLVIVTRIS